MNETSGAVHNDSDHDCARHLDRIDAARLLRAARRAMTGGDDDAIDWAFAALTDSLAARRLKITRCLEHGDIESADALIAQGLRLHPDHPSLFYLRARSYFLCGRLVHAEWDIRTVLHQRPAHHASLELAGLIAADRGHDEWAIELFENARARRPDDRRLLRLQIDTLLRIGDTVRAQEVLRATPDSAPELLASVRSSQGRLLEACEILEREVDGRGHETALCPLIDALEQLGDHDRLTRRLRMIRPRNHQALCRAARAWLQLGSFREAIRLAARLRRHDPCRREALHVLTVALALVDRAPASRRALELLQGTGSGIDPTLMADTWRRGLFARVMLHQRSPVAAGADPVSSRLQPLLQSALQLLELELAESGHRLDAQQRQELRRHQAVCLDALGQPVPRDPASRTRQRPSGDNRDQTARRHRPVLRRSPTSG